MVGRETLRGGLQDAVSGWIDSKDTGYGGGDRGNIPPHAGSLSDPQT